MGWPRSPASDFAHCGRSAGYLSDIYQLETKRPRRIDIGKTCRVVEKMHKRSTSEEYLELAELCLLEADRTLHPKIKAGLITMAQRYLEEARRLKTVERSSKS
jgi:hypothetical protein